MASFVETGPELVAQVGHVPVIVDLEEGDRCCACGSGMDFADCWNGCDDGWIPGDRLAEEDPLWYDESDTRRCSICEGDGGWWVCFTVRRDD